jgi:hypothetical protein
VAVWLWVWLHIGCSFSFWRKVLFICFLVSTVLMCWTELVSNTYTGKWERNIEFELFVILDGYARQTSEQSPETFFVIRVARIIGIRLAHPSGLRERRHLGTA